MPLRNEHGHRGDADPTPEVEAEPPVLPPAPAPEPQPKPRPGPMSREERRARMEAREDEENQRTARVAMWMALIPTGLTQLIALLMATVARSRYHASGRPVAGRDTALWARRVALLQLALVTVVSGWYLIVVRPRQAEALARAHYDASRANLRAIAIACRGFRDGPGRGQRYPADWYELLSHGYVDQQTLRSPVDEREGLSSYSYLGWRAPLVPPHKFIVAYETYDNHRLESEEGHLVVFADGRVAWVPSRRVQELIRRMELGPEN